MTAVIYARYSSDNQREESIEGQIRECTAYAEKNGITVIKHYIDRASKKIGHYSEYTDYSPKNSHLGIRQMIGRNIYFIIIKSEEWQSRNNRDTQRKDHNRSEIGSELSVYSHFPQQFFHKSLSPSCFC